MLRILLVVFSIVFCTQNYAEEEQTLADAIEELCDFKDTNIPIDELEDCILHYVNCVVGKGGKWNDKKLFKCAKDKKNE